MQAVNLSIFKLHWLNDEELCLFYVHLWVPECMYVYHVRAWSPQKPEEGIRLPEMDFRQLWSMLQEELLFTKKKKSTNKTRTASLPVILMCPSESTGTGSAQHHVVRLMKTKGKFRCRQKLGFCFMAHADFHMLWRGGLGAILLGRAVLLT